MSRHVRIYKIKRFLKLAPHYILRHWPPLFYLPGFIILLVWAGAAKVFPMLIPSMDSPQFQYFGSIVLLAFFFHGLWLLFLHYILGISDELPLTAYPSLSSSESFNPNKPFILYLRNFSSEYIGSFKEVRRERPQRVVKYRLPNGIEDIGIDPGGADEYKVVVRRPLEDFLLSLAPDRVVAVANQNDPTPPKGVHLLAAGSDVWVDEVSRLINGASCIFLFYAADSVGIIKEVRLIKINRAGRKTVALMKRDCSEAATLRDMEAAILFTKPNGEIPEAELADAIGRIASNVLKS